MMRSMTRTVTMGAKIRAARNARGWALDDVTYGLRDRYGIKTTVATLSRIESGFTAEEATSTTVVAALAKLLDLDLAVLSPHHAAERDRLLHVLEPAGVWAARDSNPEPTGDGHDPMDLAA